MRPTLENTACRKSYVLGAKWPTNVRTKNKNIFINNPKVHFLLPNTVSSVLPLVSL